MKIVSLLVLLTFHLSHLSSEAAFSYPQKEETMARVQRLLMASVMELPAEQWLADMQATGYQDIPAYKKFLEDEDLPYDKFTYNILMPFVCKIDGSNMRSTGDTDILRLTREFLTVKSTSPDWQSAAYCLLYLSQKGVGEDLPLLEKYSTLPSKLPIEKQAALDSRNILKARVAGTNVMTGLRTQYYSWSTNEPPFIPSVANTGPQAAYVYDLLKQALAKYGNATNIPPELVTMVVSFGADGKPVCDVDLAKYGLVMPDFATLAVSALSSLSDATNVPAVTTAKTPTAVPEKPAPLSRSRFVFLFSVVAGTLSALFLWRGLRERRP
jgi:hypothetical protein